MAPATSDRTSHRYSPDSDRSKVTREGNPIEWWGRRISVLLSLLVLLGIVTAFVGVRVLGPGPRLDRLERADSVQNDSLKAIGSRADAAQDEASASAYVGCELLKAMRPRDLTPSVCSPERQRLRSTR
jgi:hypothetical protein